MNLGVLDKLVTLAGELVLTRNQLTRSVGVDDAKTTAATQRLDLITTQLEDVIISTRMQSIDLVFHKFRRLVRDLSKSLGKKVELILQGEDVELDKTIIEAINDPLTHLVRNSLDHGIELPRERVEAGKPAQGMLRLSAYNKAGHVIIEIEDDGRGIDPQKVKARALAQGLYTANQLDAMSDQALVRLIFKPGFSMATNVTELSGRGVGMDVVNSNLTRLGGVVNVESIVGRGTVMRVKLPLTLAIIPCVLVSEDGEFFAIPQFNLIEFHRIPPREIKSRIKKLGDAHVMRLRGKLLPLLHLRDVLGIETTTSTPKSNVEAPDRHAPIADTRVDDLENPALVETERRKHPDPDQDGHRAAHIVIVAAGNFHFGLIVDRLQDSLEVVVKPLGRHLRDCHAYAGATILGDGRSALILDVTGISKSLKSDNAAHTTTQADTGVAKVEKQQDSMTVLVVENAENERFAIPLGLVERVERIRKSQIQVRAGKKTMTYQGKNLLLLSVEDVVDVPPRKDTEEVYTVVFRIRDREVGLLVSDLIEILDSKEETDVTTHTQNGIFGSMLIDGKATLLLDIQGIAATAIPNLKVTATPTTQTADKRRHTVLLVEDSKFFLGMISGFIEEAGHTALTAEDGLAAIEVLEREAGNVDLVLTDIMMPRLDGFAMTERIRSDPRFQNIPVIAVTSVIGTDARQRAREVGIDQYLNKLDREQIMERCNHYLKHGRAA